MKGPAPRWIPRHGRRGTLLVMLMAVVPMAFVVPEWWRQGEGQSLRCRESTVGSYSVSSGLLCLKILLIEHTFMDFTSCL